MPYPTDIIYAHTLSYHREKQNVRTGLSDNSVLLLAAKISRKYILLILTDSYKIQKILDRFKEELEAIATSKETMMNIRRFGYDRSHTTRGRSISKKDGCIYPRFDVETLAEPETER